MDFLKNLQLKSSATKAQYALGVASVVTSIIGIFWISTLSLNLSQVRLDGEDGQKKTGDTEILDLLGDAQEQFGNVIDATKEGTELLNRVTDTLNTTDISTDAPIDPSNTFSGGALDTINERHTVPETETGSLFIQKPAPVVEETDTPIIPSSDTATVPLAEKKVLIETVNIPPKTVLISTTSPKKTE